MLLLIDNYDSFTYNLFQYLSELGEEVMVVRNDKITLGEIEATEARADRHLARASTPQQAGISNDVIRHFGASADTGRLPGPPVHRLQLRRHVSAGQANHARQIIADSP